MIEAKGLGVVFPNGTEALRDINVTIDDGEFVAVIGLSGAGKSTFLRTLNGLVRPTSGTVRVGGVEVNRLSGRSLAQFRRTVGFIFQQFNLVTRLTALDNVLHGRLGYLPTWRGILGLYSERDYELAAGYLDEVGLAGKEHVRVDNLSGGQQQRVA
ncbi:phosphonate ABC transporter ATP-binding protein, partial [Oceanithermus profundus]